MKIKTKQQETLGKSGRQNLQEPVEKQSSQVNTTASTSKKQLPEKAGRKHSTTSIKIGSVFKSPEHTEVVVAPMALIYTTISKNSEAAAPPVISISCTAPSLGTEHSPYLETAHFYGIDYRQGKSAHGSKVSL